MAATPADVKATAKELASVDDAVVQRFLDDVEELEDVAARGSRADLFHKYATAHLMVSLGLGSGAASMGTVSSMSVGGVSVTYDTSKMEDSADGLGSTPYGRVIQKLNRRFGLRMLVVP